MASWVSLLPLSRVKPHPNPSPNLLIPPILLCETRQWPYPSVILYAAFFESYVRDRFAGGSMSRYIVYLDVRDRAWIVDFNVWGGRTDCGPLFDDWSELSALGNCAGEVGGRRWRRPADAGNEGRDKGHEIHDVRSALVLSRFHEAVRPPIKNVTYTHWQFLKFTPRDEPLCTFSLTKRGWKSVPRSTLFSHLHRHRIIKCHIMSTTYCR